MLARLGLIMACHPTGLGITDRPDEPGIGSPRIRERRLPHPRRGRSVPRVVSTPGTTRHRAPPCSTKVLYLPTVSRLLN